MELGDFLLALLMLVGAFLMFVILLQRGRGGGLAGAFGGLGGQSAFGTKAGDVFTVITIVTVCIWVVLACLTGARLKYEENRYGPPRSDSDLEAVDEVKKAPGSADDADDSSSAAGDEQSAEGKADATEGSGPSLEDKSAPEGAAQEPTESGAAETPAGDQPEKAPEN